MLLLKVVIEHLKQLTSVKYKTWVFVVPYLSQSIWSIFFLLQVHALSHLIRTTLSSGHWRDFVCIIHVDKQLRNDSGIFCWSRAGFSAKHLFGVFRQSLLRHWYSGPLHFHPSSLPLFDTKGSYWYISIIHKTYVAGNSLYNEGIFFLFMIDGYSC